MQKNLIPEGDYLTVIRRAEVLPWGTMPHRALGLTLEICGGPQSGGGLFRWIFFDAFQPERARELFGRLGGRLSRVEEIDRDAPGLVCNLLRVICRTCKRFQKCRNPQKISKRYCQRRCSCV